MITSRKCMMEGQCVCECVCLVSQHSPNSLDLCQWRKAGRSQKICPPQCDEWCMGPVGIAYSAVWCCIISCGNDIH